MQVVAAGWDEDDSSVLRRAIHARHVMNNDVSRLLDAQPPISNDELPYWIWYPTLPSASTLCRLAETREAMRPQCIRACIAGGYRMAYSKIMTMSNDTKSGENILPAADADVIMEAEASPDGDFFVADLKRRQQEQEITPLLPTYDRWKNCIPWRSRDPSSSVLLEYLADGASSVVHEGQGY
ncbi:hypothetical protein EsDP_00004679 [Epichloe bromicola]|uniref:Uncharacterized protein n=1 Tax=Epichloe bromicola TaxID=79588 RepID=A0ABQ0CSE7_9HYPO